MKMTWQEESSSKPRTRGSRGLSSICRPLPDQMISLGELLVNRSGPSDTTFQPLKLVAKSSGHINSRHCTASLPSPLPAMYSNEVGSNTGLERIGIFVLARRKRLSNVIDVDDSAR